MKKLFTFLLCFVLFFCASAAAESTPEAVVEMPYILKKSDYDMREGKYTGQIVNGLPNGYGVFIVVNSSGTTLHYIGEWAEGKMSGRGGEYWDSGSSFVGTFKDNDFICGHVRQVIEGTITHLWVDNTPNEHGCTTTILYRPDGSKRAECCAVPGSDRPHIVTVYRKDGKVFFSGEAGEAFSLNLIDLD